MSRTARLALAVAALACAGCIHIYEPRPQASAEAPKRSGDAAKDDKEKKPFKPWKKALKDAEAIDGMLRLHRARDGKLLVELPEGRMGRDFGLLMHYSRGLGVYNVHDGLVVSGTRLVRFRRSGEKVLLVETNPRFTADEGSPMRSSVDDNVGHSIAAALEIVSVHDDGRLLVDATPFLLSDYGNIGRRLERAHGGKNVKHDAKRSVVERVQAFPENVEIDVLLTYRPSGPPSGASAGVSDYRSIPIGLRYSLFELPAEPMTPRVADDRVGHFLTAIQDFSRDREKTSYVRLVNRWRLEKKDPSAPVSEPVEPIVYYIDRSVPHEYRRYVREGIEGWNRAFEKAGFKNAVVAREAPGDESWSAEDVRYSTVRWTAAHRMGYAIGPSQVDPRTGEILNADILISSTFVRGWLFDYQEMGPGALAARLVEGDRLPKELPPELAEQVCMAEIGKSHQIGVQYALMAGLGHIAPGTEMPEEYLGDAIRDLIMHEVGHTLGLRHNFKASSAVPFERLHDESFTGVHGVAVSVMDYNPVNISADPKAQGHYWNKTVGDYDLWAIEYAYSSDAGDEPDHARLASIARRAPEPLLAYGTDEDARFGSFGVDPLTNTWDLGSDVVAYARERSALVARVMPQLEPRVVEEGEGYQRLRSAYGSLMFERSRSVFPAMRAIGGLYAVRDHKGDPGGRLPFQPVPAPRQREALSLIVSETLSPTSWSFDAGTLNKLAPEHWSHWGVSRPPDPTFPAHAFVASSQASIVGQLLDPVRLGRLLDNELRVAPGEDVFTMAELFGSLDAAIWSELGGLDAAGSSGLRTIGSFRRNLQRIHVNQLSALLLDTSRGILAVPEDAKSLARWSLTRIARRIASLETSSRADAATRAHLLETRARIERALEASITLGPARGRP